ncbi:MAG: hypothetical protein HY288_03200 [Planctomycetia bacterium]|nr:hypothetical protein [Planctomycetia bacterium]
MAAWLSEQKLTVWISEPLSALTRAAKLRVASRIDKARLGKGADRRSAVDRAEFIAIYHAARHAMALSSNPVAPIFGGLAANNRAGEQ